MFSAKFILLKVFGALLIVIGLIYLFLPQTLLQIIGIDLGVGVTSSLELYLFMVRSWAGKNILIGLFMLLSRGGAATHYMLWLFVVNSFIEAVAGLGFTTGQPIRQLAPLWIAAIMSLFFVGLAYGLDIAGVFVTTAVKEERKNDDDKPQTAEKVHSGKNDKKDSEEKITIVYQGEEKSKSS